MRGHELFDGPDVLGEVLDRDGDVLDDRDRLVVAAHAHQETETGLAYRPDILLSRRIEHDDGIGARANAAGDEVGLEALGLLLQLRIGLAVVLDHEHGGGIAFDHRDLAREAWLRSRQIDQHATHQLDRGGIGLEDHRRRGHGCDELVELKQHQTGPGRSRHEPEGDLEQCGQRAFGRDQQPGGIELGVGFEQLVERIAGGTTPVRRKIARDQPTVALPERQKLAVEAPLGVIDACPASHRGGRDGTEIENGAVDRGGFHRLHVIAGHAVEDRVRPGRVVADDAAGGGAISGSGIGAEHHSMWFQLAIEGIDIDSRLDGDETSFEIDLEHPRQHLGEVDHQRRADGLPGER